MEKEDTVARTLHLGAEWTTDALLQCSWDLLYFFLNIQHNFCCKDTSSPLLSARKWELLAGNNLQPKGHLIFPQLAIGNISIPWEAWSKFFQNPRLAAFFKAVWAFLSHSFPTRCAYSSQLKTGFVWSWAIQMLGISVPAREFQHGTPFRATGAAVGEADLSSHNDVLGSMQCS